MTTTSTIATETLLFEVVDEGKKNLGLSYAYLSQGDFRLPAAHVERGCAAAGEPAFVRGDGGYTSFGRSAQPGFVARAT